MENNIKWVPRWAEKIIQDENWDRTQELIQEQNMSVRPHKIIAQLIEQGAIKQADPIELSIQKALPSVGTIWIKTPKEKWNGSGFLLPNNRFLTAAHVVEGISSDSSILVTFDDEEFIDAQVISSDSSVDCAVLLLKNTPDNIEPLRFVKSEQIKIGEQVAVIGAPSGWHDIVTVGRISSINQSVKNSNDPAFQDIIFIDADIEPGSSGSPVIDVNGNVIGTVMALIGQHADLGLGQKAVSPASKIVKKLVQADE